MTVSGVQIQTQDSTTNLGQVGAAEFSVAIGGFALLASASTTSSNLDWVNAEVAAVLADSALSPVYRTKASA
ncbi:protein of unknown function (plasmid) [Cupriavidus taiwanensis]|nr:protein of unknown function [Cupriavidus taiwanensis]